MDNIRRHDIQNPLTLRIDPYIQTLTESGLYATGPGFISYNMGRTNNLYVVFGDQDVLDPVKRLRSVLHVMPVHGRAKLYTDLNGTYYLCSASMKPGIICHGSDICLGPEGILSNRDLVTDTLQWSDYHDWTPFCLDTFTIPIYMYFLSVHNIQFTKKTLDHVLKQLYGRTHNDADSSIDLPHINTTEFNTYFELYRNFF